MPSSRSGFDGGAQFKPSGFSGGGNGFDAPGGGFGGASAGWQSRGGGGGFNSSRGSRDRGGGFAPVDSFNDTRPFTRLLSTSFLQRPLSVELMIACLCIRNCPN